MANNPKVFLDIAVSFKTVGRIVIELFANTNPETAENFRALCPGENGVGDSGMPLHYKGSIIHRMIPDKIWYGGDITHGNGFGGESIYGYHFQDEKFIEKHDRKGILSMVKSDENTIGSQFMLLMTEYPDVDGKQVAFGKVLDGFKVISEVEKMSVNGLLYPSQPVTIAHSGQILDQATSSGPKLVSYPVPADIQKLLNQLRAWQLKVLEMENALANQTMSYAMGNRKIKIKESMALQALLMAPRPYEAVDQSVPHEREGDVASHNIPGEQ